MPIVDLVLPKLGESIMEATILKWHKKVGDTIQLDETLLDIATDKVDSEIPSTAEGVIVELLYDVNSVVPIGTVIAKIDSNKAAANTPKPITTSSPTPPPTTTPTVKAETETVPYTPTIVSEKPCANHTDTKFFSPLVISIAQSEGISLQELQHIQGTGNQGRVSKKDILQDRKSVV